jgi:hypothetical protein
MTVEMLAQPLLVGGIDPVTTIDGLLAATHEPVQGEVIVFGQLVGSTAY